MLRLQIDRTNKEKQYQSREAKLRRSAAICRTYEEEIFTKDSEILKREKALAALEKNNEGMKKRESDTSVRIKSAVAEELAAANAALAEKENEIKLLKEMVRSSKRQMEMVEKNALVFRKRD